MNKDCQLIFEAYKKVDPNECRFPQKPKFQIGEVVNIKNYRHSTFVGDHSSAGKTARDWITQLYPNLVGKVVNIECYTNTGKLPTYYYEILPEDKRYPELNSNTIICAAYEIRRGKLTVDDTQSISDIMKV